jgi:hypothetical protein
MIISSDAILKKVAIHHIGNSGKEEGVRISDSELRLREEINLLLSKYFLTPFKTNHYYNLHHETDLNLNEVFHFASAIFDDNGDFFNNTVNIARHLYTKSSHPNIKPGELYVTYFSDMILDGEETDAVGIFKSESKETFLKVFPSENNYIIVNEEGIDIRKLDKGCLIFNTERENGYICAIIDNTGKNNDAHYWYDEFLKVKERNDEFYQTRDTLDLCRQFVSVKLPDVFDVDKPAQAELLNKSMKFFKEKDNFEMEEFVSEVFVDNEVINTFNEYRKDFEAERQMKLPDNFDISEQAVRKQARVFKSILKLDKNFHVYIHGNRENIERGYDDNRNMHYYKIYFEEEN